MAGLSPQSNNGFFAVATIVVAVAIAAVVSPDTAESAAPPETSETVARPSVLPPTPPLVIGTPTRIRICLVEPGLSDGAGVQISGSVIYQPSGEVLWEVEAATPVVPASVLKLVTARAALRVLGPEFRFTTRVVEGAEPGEIWLVGGGDPTLTRTRPGSPTYYTNPASVFDLVNQVTAAAGSTPAPEAFAKVGIDSSRYREYPSWNDTWRANAAALGFVAPVTALMVDGGRLAPAGRLAARTTDPVGQATEAFMAQLGEATGFWRSELVNGRAPPTASAIAEVSSPPLSVLVEQMIRDSDNQIAEALIREVAIALSVGDFDEAARAGLDGDPSHDGAFFADDGSGLSQNNVMTAALATTLMSELLDDPDATVIIDALPAPGEPGSLQRRFAGAEHTWSAIAGKTGSLSGVRSLAGVITGEDSLVFSVFVTGQRVNDESREVIDALVTRFHTCGENLAHWVPTEPGE